MKISFVTGPMGSGKSRKLIEDYLQDETKKIALAAHLKSIAGEAGTIESRNGSRILGYNLSHDNDDENLFLLLDLINRKEYKTFYIDEIQFLSSSMIDQIFYLAKVHDLEIKFYGLLSDFTSKMFKSSEFLLGMLKLESITYLEMKCEEEDCDNLARQNARIVNGKITRTGETFIEEKSTYKSLCNDCYLK